MKSVVVLYLLMPVMCHAALVKTKEEPSTLDLYKVIRTCDPTTYDYESFLKLKKQWELLSSQGAKNSEQLRTLIGFFNAFDTHVYTWYLTLKNHIDQPLTQEVINQAVQQASRTISAAPSANEDVSKLGKLVIILGWLKWDGSVIRLLKDLLPRSHLSDETWNHVGALADSTVQILQEFINSQAESAAQVQKYITSLLPMLEIAKSKIEDWVEDGATIIGFGNTPQYIMEALKYNKKFYQLISIAFSGHPGKHEPVRDLSKTFRNLLTPQGLANFKNYLHSLKLDPAGNHTAFYIIDTVGTGLGIEFFVWRLYEHYQEAQVPFPPLKIISINPRDRCPTYDKDTKQFVGATLTIDELTLDMVNLAHALDHEYEIIRVMPEFPALRWHHWHPDPTQIPVGKYALTCISAIKKYFEDR